MNPGASGPCTSPLTGNPLTDLLPDPVTGVCGDVYYPTTLSYPGGEWMPGTYILALTLAGNAGVGNLSDGFFASTVLGLPAHSNFTCQVGAPGYQGNPPTAPVDGAFCDQWMPGVQRTGTWALDILNVDSAAALPEPATLPCAVAALVAGLALRRRRR